jgi:hypothetical protein
MGHHIDDQGRFQSDRHPDLPPDRIRLNLANPRSVGALRQLAKDYAAHDPELASDLNARLTALHGPPPLAAINEALGLMNSMILCGEDHTETSRAVLERAREALLELGGVVRV